MMWSLIEFLPFVLSAICGKLADENSRNQILVCNFRNFRILDEKSIQDLINRELIRNKLFSVICIVSHCVAFLFYKETFFVSRFFYVLFALVHFIYVFIPKFRIKNSQKDLEEKWR